VIASASTIIDFSVVLPPAGGSGIWVLVVKADVNPFGVNVVDSNGNLLASLSAQWQAVRYVDSAVGNWSIE
jgi:hypothetical protein